MEDAAASQGDSGKAGVSAKAVAAGLGVAAGAVAAVAASKSSSQREDSTNEDTTEGPVAPVSRVARVESEPRMLTDDEIDEGSAAAPSKDGTDELGNGRSRQV